MTVATRCHIPPLSCPATRNIGEREVIIEVEVQVREQVVRYKEVRETDCSSVVQAVLQPLLHNWERLQRYGEEEDTTKGHTSIHFILSCPDSELHLTVH